MSNAGWYPDPSGQPGQYRYWDGSGWSAETASNPSAPPPGSGGAPQTPPSGYPTQVAPQQQPGPPPGGGYNSYNAGGGGGYGGYPPQQGQPSWGGAPSDGSGGGNGKTIGIVIGVVVLVIALGVGTFLVVRGLSGDGGDEADDDPTTSQTETETETQTETDDPPPETETDDPPPESETADPTSLACAGGVPDQGGDGISGGKLSGGGLSVDQVAGYEPEFTVGEESYSQDGAFDFADAMTTVSRLVQDGWVAGYGVGSLARDRGYDTPQQAAQTAMSCLEQSDNYRNVTRRDVLDEGDVDLGPTTGYSITCDILAEAPGGIPGDRVIMTVVDLGDDQPFGFFISYVPLGYNDLLRTQESVGETLVVN